MASSKGDAFFFNFDGKLESKNVERKIVIKKRNPLRKAEMPILAIFLFYFFIFYAMSGGNPGLMISKLFSMSNGIIGLTLAVLGFGITVLLNLMQVSRITLSDSFLVASSRTGYKKKYDLNKLDACRMKWYDGKDRRYPFFQFNFKDGRMLQIAGHHYTGLKPFILSIRKDLRDQLIEIKD